MTKEPEIGIALVRRLIGREMRSLRKQADLTQDEAAGKLQRSRMTLVRIEDGDFRIRFRESDVRAMLELYRAKADRATLLLALTAETRNAEKPWWQDYTADTTALFAVYISLEDAAQTIRQYESELVHGLLQTRAYALEINGVLAGHWDDTEIDRQVSLRMERQSLLSRPRAPHLIAALHEGALRTIVGGPAVMGEQLRHLIALSQQSNISIRVIPFAAGVHGGMTGGPFTLLDFPADSSGERSEPPLVYLDALTGANHLTRPAEITLYQHVWDHLLERALGENSSREMITAILEGLPQ